MGSGDLSINIYIYIYIYFDKIKSTLAFIFYRLFHTDFDVCNHQELKRKWVIKQQKTSCSQLVSKLNFHFHHSFEEVAGNVKTMGPDLLAHVE